MLITKTSDSKALTRWIEYSGQKPLKPDFHIESLNHHLRGCKDLGVADNIHLTEHCMMWARRKLTERGCRVQSSTPLPEEGNPSQPTVIIHWRDARGELECRWLKGPTLPDCFLDAIIATEKA